MKKFVKKDYFYIISLLLIYGLILYLITDEINVYGSTTDWSNQHIPLADYFRELFYQTKNLFPSFSMSLGAGQNIYNFAYYGLLSPIVCLSYLFPNITMSNFIIISIIIVVAISIVLFYFWLRNNEYKSPICFIVTFLFMCASPIIFHTHRHIMFINYLPFLLLGLISIDNYFKNNKKFLLALSVFLMIMSSYFYSIGGLFVLAIYATYKFIKNNNKFNLKEYLILIRNLIIPVIIGILSSSILILPIASIITKGRIGVQDVPTFFDFLPSSNLHFLFYTPYGLGLTSAFLIALIYVLTKKDKSTRFLSITFALILFFPLIVYILNGGLYINSKVLIPFLPIFCLIYAEFFKDFSENKIELKKILIPFLILLVFIILTEKYKYEIYYYIGCYIEIILTFILFIISIKTNKKMLFVFPLLSLVLILNIIVNNQEEYLTKERFQVVNDELKTELIKDTLNNDKSFYRFSNTTDTYDNVNKVYDKYYFSPSIYSSTYNNDYNNFFFKEFNNENPYRNTGLQYSGRNILYDTLMGVKYKLSTFHDSKLYKKVKQKDILSVYENPNVYSIGYATKNTMNIKDYNKLEYPYNMDALLNASINNKETNFNFNTNIKELNWDFNDLKIKNKNGVVKFKNKKETVKRIYLPEPLENKILIISFIMNKSQDCKKGDTWIKINGVKNKLTCNDWKYRNDNYSFDYVISSKNKIKSLKITMSEGNFNISNLKLYTMDFDYIKNLDDNIDKLDVKRKDIKENGFTGTINVREDSNFVLTIPYDNGFKIKVDDKLMDYEKVNYAFIGFDIKKGKHKVEVIYEPPLKKLGMSLSILSLVAMIGLFFND